MTYLYNEEKIDAHPEWGRLRQMRYTENFLSGSHETDILLARLYEQNPQNRTALEYLLAYTLQKRDLKGFMNYYPSDANINHEPFRAVTRKRWHIYGDRLTRISGTYLGNCLRK